MDDRRIKRKDNKTSNKSMNINQDDNIYNSFNQNNNMNNSFKNASFNNNNNNSFNNGMNNSFNNNNMNNNFNNNNNNMNNNFNNNNNNMNNNFNNNNNNMNNNFNNNNNNMNNNFNNNSYIDKTTHQYHEKEYKTGTLEENTVVTKASKVSRVFLVGFYMIFLVIGVMVFFMLRANKYEFYLKNDEVNVYTGCDYQVELIPKDIRYFDYLNYNYSIADTNIATVDEFGKITAVGTGTTTLKISLSPGFTSKTMKIHAEKVDIQSINIRVYKNDKIQAGDVIAMNPDQSVSLKALVNNREDLTATVKYSSSDTNVATVDEFGNVTAKGEGTAVISGDKDGITGKITINVRKKSSSGGSNTIKSISFAASSDNVTIKKGNTFQLSLVVNPKSMSSSSFTWVSDNSNIVSVNSKGVVTGVENGETTVTVSSLDGKTAKTKIKVTDEEIKISKIALNTTSTTIYVGGTYQLNPKITPTTATVRSVNWSSSNESVASVDQNGVVTGKSAGTADITISTSDGKVKASCKVTVKKYTQPTATPTPEQTATEKITKVTMDIGQTEKYVGDTLQLSVSVEPSSATNYKVSWSTNNSKVATVNSKGVVTAKKAGTVVITATVDGVKATSTIIVRNRTTPTSAPTTKPTSGPSAPSGSQFSVAQAKLSKTSTTISKGKTDKFTISINKAVAKVVITSDNPSVAKVSVSSALCNSDNNTCLLDSVFDNASTGVATVEVTITGVAAGTAKINVTAAELIDDKDNDLSGKSGSIGVLVK